MFGKPYLLSLILATTLRPSIFLYYLLYSSSYGSIIIIFAHKLTISRKQNNHLQTIQFKRIMILLVYKTLKLSTTKTTKTSSTNNRVKNLHIRLRTPLTNPFATLRTAGILFYYSLCWKYCSLADSRLPAHGSDMASSSARLCACRKHIKTIAIIPRAGALTI